MDYKEKYYKYKSKYLSLRNNLNMIEYGSKKDSGHDITIYNTNTTLCDELKQMYFMHNTRTIESLLQILKDGTIKAGKDVNECFRFYSGGEPQKYIYSNVYFSDLKNLTFLKTGVILHPKIIHDFQIVMTKGWMCTPEKDSITINKNDTNSVKLDKIKKFKSQLLSKNIMEHVMTWPGQLQHEILLSQPVDVRKYVIAMACPVIYKKKLEKMIKKLGYNIKVIPIEDDKDGNIVEKMVYPHDLF